LILPSIIPGKTEVPCIGEFPPIDAGKVQLPTDAGFVECGVSGVETTIAGVP
jgi:hypothetical protein